MNSPDLGGTRTVTPNERNSGQPGIGARAFSLIYGVAAYTFFFVTFIYLIGFVGNWVVPKSIDSGELAGSIASAVAIDVLLLGLFAIQHTIMARPAFKQWWTRYVPSQLERSTFVLFATALLAFMAWQWRPLPKVVWQVEQPVAVVLLSSISLAGWGIVLISTFLIDHFELFGLRQTVLYAIGRSAEHPKFKERLFYRWVRHPLMSGFLIAFWFTPVMTQGHLLFAVVTTLYVLIGVKIEEHTLIFLHGERYEDYRQRVSMLIPMPRRRKR